MKIERTDKYITTFHLCFLERSLDDLNKVMNESYAHWENVRFEIKLTTTGNYVDLYGTKKVMIR